MSRPHRKVLLLGLRRQRPAVEAMLVRFYLPVLGLLLVVTGYLLGAGVPFNNLSRDAFEVLGGPGYVGLWTNVGVLFWAAAASVSLAGFIADPRGARGRFFLFVGLLSAALALDDMFGLHEHLFPALGLPSVTMQIGYGAALATLIVRYRGIVLQTEFFFLLAACAGLGLSAAVDVVLDAGIRIPHPYLLEDGLKLIGIMSWCVFVFRSVVDQLRPAAVENRNSGDAGTLAKAWDSRPCREQRRRRRVAAFTYRGRRPRGPPDPAPRQE